MTNVHDEPNGKQIVSLFQQLGDKKQYPNLKFWLDLDPSVRELKFYPATGKWRGYIVVNDGKQYPNSTVFARIDMNNGNIIWHTTVPWLKDVIRNICSSPVEVAAMNGRDHKTCCFCGLELTDPRSVDKGYGPICAANWGLPWDQMDTAMQDIEIEELDEIRERVNTHQINNPTPSESEAPRASLFPNIVGSGEFVVEIKTLRYALEESIKLQSHYANLLNDYDGGNRLTFSDADEWISRLAEIREIHAAADRAGDKPKQVEATNNPAKAGVIKIPTLRRNGNGNGNRSS